jgi:hypothetical protein
MNIFEEMLERHEIKTGEQRRNATHEVMQETTLAGLYGVGFDKAAFYGVKFRTEKRYKNQNRS